MYADDVAKVFLLQDAGQYRSATASTAIAYLTASETFLHDCSEPAGIAPNDDKTEAIPTFSGKAHFMHAEFFRALARSRQVDDIWVVCILTLSCCLQRWAGAVVGVGMDIGA